MSVFWLWWEIVLKMRIRFYKKNLLGYFIILLVVVSVCVVLCVLCCLQNNPVFLSVTISHILKNENYELCFFAGSYLCWSNYDQKKRYSRLAVGWNKSQITVCRVKIQTPPITLYFKKILIGFLCFTETMRSKLSVTVYLFLALYGSTTSQSRSFLKNIKNFLCKEKLVYNCSIPSMHTERKITVCSHKHSFTPYPSLSPYWQTE